MEKEEEESSAAEKRKQESKIRSLVTHLAFSSTESSLSSIRHLSKTSPSSRSLLIDAGLIPNLLPLLLHPNPPSIQSLASATLLNLSISHPQSLMSTPSLLTYLSRAFRTSPAPDVLMQNLSATICSILSVEAFRPVVGSKRGIVESLVGLLGSQVPRNVKDALRALFVLSLYALNRPVVVEVGAVPLLFSLLREGVTRGLMEDATAVIAQVAGCYESVDAFREVYGVRVLAELLQTEGRVGENAASGLLNLARRGGERAVGDIREVDGVEDALEELVERGSERGRVKGEEMLRILRRGRGCCGFWSEDSEVLDDSSLAPAMSTSSSSSCSSLTSVREW